ncbi:formyltetrahydrofolate deformylase [Candidatus Methylopumilus planktonicus]|uniref:formyltetrahydrofolate deformylase n=1 Tax=Candidatus Methylopumilus planktonicus TaxID=1581557 RepID=UPI00111F698F|nr:formyltetrahydrofolate deformylase [Candidatus Methylopumilus planktonicus]QDD07446.1 formyltetrahydrofolate deformylase [Candidatus Methylopumilus planktonicus]QDD08775.1 formyltetrahydrofolate deformylase [Candidatus Methylopumilus planktonicus]QDD10097.1 formyltetrahydrofolate deformylase [Candidatus Methylopumilus planktonicus]
MKNSATLLITCPDAKGIVAAIADFLYQHNANILHADQHQDAENSLFLMRVEWDLKDFSLDEASFARAFEVIAKTYKMTWELKLSADKPRMAIMVSQYDHCLADLLHRYKNNELQCDIPLIISNHLNAQKLAEFYGIPFFHIPVEKDKKKEAEAEQFALFDKYQVDFIVLARYMQILSEDFVKRYPQRVINIHHSFLPAFIGAKPYHRAFERGVKLIGATSHYVTEVLDEGPIIEQNIDRISHRDQVEDLIQKGRDLERIVLYKAVRWHIENRILIYGNKTVIFD